MKNPAHRIAYAWRTDTRYYKLFLYQDLLGHWVLVRIWGGLHNNRHGKKQMLFDTYEAGQRCVKQITKMRKRRGYSVSE